MKLHFLGANRQVTGSRYCLEVAGNEVLIDCGMFQERKFQERNWDRCPIAADQIAALLLTHVHIDHCGLIPKLVKEGFRGPIHTTEPSAGLIEIMLRDSAEIQQEDVGYKRKRHQKQGRKGPFPYEPLYTEEDVDQTLPLVRGYGYGQPVQVTPEVTARFFDAGHILGSSMIQLDVSESGRQTRIVFSGDIGQSERAMVRLLGEATRHGNDPELFAGLVHACRYAGLFEESVAAHAEARRLDPNIVTSFQQTMMMKGDIDRLVSLDPRDRIPTGDHGIRVIGLGLAGRRDEARQALADMSQQSGIQTFQVWMSHLGAWLDRRIEDMMSTLATMTPLKIFDDPEAIFQEGWLLCDAGEPVRGLEYLQRAVARGYFVVPTLTGWPQFDALRDVPAFQTMLADAEAGRQRALAAFREAGGELLLAR